MAITEENLKTMHETRLDDREDKTTELVDAEVDLVEDPENPYPRNFYLISDSHKAYAHTSADALGIPRKKVVWITEDQPLRAKAIMNFRALHKDQLIGFFSDLEIKFLTNVEVDPYTNSE